jgi:predicted nuclease of restriction endonuclease-like RecB superfamily
MSTPLPARVTTYRGVPMRSRLEAHWAQRLDGLGANWWYEPRRFTDETGQYLPDFKVVLPADTTVYLEVKGSWPENDLDDLRSRMGIVWSSEPDALLMLAVGRDVWLGTFDGGWNYQGDP